MRPVLRTRRPRGATASTAVQGHRERGLALILVLGLVIFLTLIALNLSDTLRLGNAMTANAISAIRAQAAADGAVHRMLVELQRPREPVNPDNPAWRPNGKRYAWQEDDLAIEVSAQSEAANIDLNFAAEPLLKQLFVSAGASEDEANAIVAAIRDWTDADSLTRPNGAEADEYRAQGRKTLPANELFVAVEELKNVLGITPELYAAVAPKLTVHSRSAGVDPFVASLDVLLAVPGLDPGQVSAWVAERDAAIDADLPPPPLPFASPYLSGGGAGAIRIKATATAADGIRAAREASVRPGAARRVAPQFQLWQRMARSAGQPANPAPEAGPRE